MGSTGETYGGPRLTALGTTPQPAWLTAERIASVRAAEDLPFSPDEYASRLATVRDAMSRTGLDGMFVFRPSSVEYLCGYHSKETAPQPLLVTHADTFLHVPDLELGRSLAGSNAGAVLYSGYANARHALSAIAEHATDVLGRGARIGIEVEHASTPPLMVEILREHDVTVVHGDHLVERVRLVLSPAEIRYVEEAAAATQRGVEAAVDAAGRAGATDSSVAAGIAAGAYDGANAASVWGPVVATGQRGGIPHSSWVGTPLAEGPTFIEFAGAHHRYHAPVMRTLCRGRPSPETRRLADLAASAITAVLEHATPGVPCQEVAAAALAAIGHLRGDEGRDTVFHHLFGYPVGLAHPPHWMDSAPFYITADNPEPLREGMVFHIPGSFRSFGRMGVGLSQTFVVESTGGRPLTHGSAELIQL